MKATQRQQQFEEYFSLFDGAARQIQLQTGELNREFHPGVTSEYVKSIKSLLLATH